MTNSTINTMAQFLGFDRITVSDLESYVVICTDHKNGIVEMINSSKTLDEKIDFVFDQLNQIVSYSIIVWEIASSNISNIMSHDALIYSKTLDDICNSIKDVEFDFEPIYDKARYIKLWMDQRYDNDIIKQIMDIRESVSSSNEYSELSKAYNNILHLGYKSALSLRCESITEFYNKKRLHTNDETIYDLIRSALVHYDKFDSTDTLMDQIIKDSRNHYCENFTVKGIHTSDEYVVYFKTKTVGLLKSAFTKYVSVIDCDDSMLHVRLNSDVRYREHRIIIVLDGATFSHSTYFVNDGIIYHLIALKNRSSFYHELGHVMDTIMMFGNEDNSNCVFITGKQFLKETTPIIFEHFQSESQTKYKHQEPLSILMCGFDYHVNRETYHDVPTQFDVIAKFNTYISMIFPNVTNDTNIPYYLMDGTLINNTGGTIDYYVNYLEAVHFYEGPLDKNMANMDLLVEKFMKKKLLIRSEVINDKDLKF
jgi:hypothetical protein